jgi:diguanylate cyclase (GGDEF)-like protein
VNVVKLRDGVAITASDITQRKLDEARMLHHAEHDHLTGLANRTLLNDRIRQACALSARNQSLTGVFLVDLDNFKKVNDSLGHAAGDAVLQEASRRLLGAVRAVDSIVRLGGDEFVIVCFDAAGMPDLHNIARKVIVAFEEPFVDLPEELVVTCSVGIVASDGQQTPDELLAQADTAMYLAKQRGKNQFQVYTPPMGHVMDRSHAARMDAAVGSC